MLLVFLLDILGRRKTADTLRTIGDVVFVDAHNLKAALVAAKLPADGTGGDHAKGRSVVALNLNHGVAVVVAGKHGPHAKLHTGMRARVGSG